MQSQLLIQEMVKAAQGERDWTGAPRNRATTRSYIVDKGGLAAGARYMIGGALVRAGRYLNGSTAPRPEPSGT
jgi:hypothetical protein